MNGDAERRLVRSRRIYGLLVRLYPAAHRHAFGEQMVQMFADHYRDVVVRRGGSRSRFWLSVLTDAGTSLATEYGAALSARRGSIRPLWYPAAAAAGGGLLLLTATVRPGPLIGLLLLAGILAAMVAVVGRYLATSPVPVHRTGWVRAALAPAAVLGGCQFVAALLDELVQPRHPAVAGAGIVPLSVLPALAGTVGMVTGYRTDRRRSGAGGGVLVVLTGALAGLLGRAAHPTADSFLRVGLLGGGTGSPAVRSGIALAVGVVFVCLGAVLGVAVRRRARRRRPSARGSTTSRGFVLAMAALGASAWGAEALLGNAGAGGMASAPSTADSISALAGLVAPGVLVFVAMRRATRPRCRSRPDRRATPAASADGCPARAPAGRDPRRNRVRRRLRYRRPACRPARVLVTTRRHRLVYRGRISAVMLMAALAAAVFGAGVATGHPGASAAVAGAVLAGWLAWRIRLIRPLPAGPGGDGPAPPGGASVREPRRPLPVSPAGSAARPRYESERSAWCA